MSKKTYKELLQEKFDELKNKWHQTNRKAGDECLGNTFEDLIGKKEDNLSVADFGDIEIKSHRISTNSKVSLFSKSPNGRGVNSNLRKKYGQVDDDGYTVLNVCVSTTEYSQYKDEYKFKLEVDDDAKKIWLLVKDKNGNVVEDKNIGEKNGIFWEFKKIENVIDKKIKNIAIVYGEEKTEEKVHKVKFTKIVFIMNITFDNVIKKIKSGDLYLELRLGVYKSGKNMGKNHDHGSAFRMPIGTLLTIKDENDNVIEQIESNDSIGISCD